VTDLKNPLPHISYVDCEVATSVSYTYLWRTTLQQEKRYTEKAEHNKKILLYKTTPDLNGLVGIKQAHPSCQISTTQTLFQNMRLI
jgi:hypothetical protein